jgi:hypothetical protein
LVLFFVGCCGNSVVGRILEVKDFWKDFLLGERRGEKRGREEERFGEMGSLQKLGNG